MKEAIDRAREARAAAEIRAFQREPAQARRVNL